MTPQHHPGDAAGADSPSPDTSAVHADPELRTLLARIHRQAEISQHHANQLLARVVWSRLIEPGDHTAGALISHLGAEPLLRLVSTGAGTRQILAAVQQRSTELGEDHNAELSAGENDALATGGRVVSAGLRRWLPRLDRAATLADLRRSLELGISLVTPEDNAWPARLNDLGFHAPVSLWVRGDPNQLHSHALAIVGARAASGYGTHITAEITDGVCAAGITVVSGAAYGIDAVAHRTSLAVNAPTIAVLAGGLDRPYPAAHRQLIDHIAEHGAVCSEMVPGTAPTRWRFLQRNRIISALSAATLVTEAGTRSGSINTAGNSAELGRPLGAVPGPVTSAASAGCHKLIRDYGAVLVTNTSEALELLGVDHAAQLPLELAAQGNETSRQSSLHQRVLDSIPLRGARSLTEISRSAGTGPGETRGAVAELELLGLLIPHDTPRGGEAAWALQRR